MIVATVTCADYLFMVFTMAESVKRNHPECKVVLCLVEDSIHPLLENNKQIDDIILAKDLGILNFEECMFKYSKYEAAISVRGQFFKFLLEHYPDEGKFIYLDPDIKVFGRLDELCNSLDEHPIVLTPHNINPNIEEFELIYYIERYHLQFGIFNQGVFGFSRTEETRRFLDWFSEKLRLYCFNDLDNGLFVDQKWVDYVPIFFKAFVLKHPGYNVAFWNLFEREIYGNKNFLTVNGLPLKCFHFSNILSGYLVHMCQKHGNNKKLLLKLCNEYEKELLRNRKREIQNNPWSYDYYDSGEKISQEAKVYFLNNINKFLNVNPFSLSNSEILNY